jgi:hypothetical protein
VTYFSQTAAAPRVDPNCPPSVDTLRLWHDRLGGPRDSAGRRIYTDEMIERIKAARQKVARR